MRRLLMWGLVAGFAACLLRPTLATITPDYSYVDGCETVVIQGHHLGTAAKARIGEAEFLSLAPAKLDPKLPEQAQDVGFEYIGVVPAAPGGKPGWHDVTLEVDGEELVIRDGWYYRSCPATFAVDTYTLPPDEIFDLAGINVDPGDAIAFEGCGLDERVRAQFFDELDQLQGDAALISDCLTHLVHVAIPVLPEGAYTVALVHPDGTTFPLCTAQSDSGDTASTCVPDVLVIKP